MRSRLYVCIPMRRYPVVRQFQIFFHWLEIFPSPAGYYR